MQHLGGYIDACCAAIAADNAGHRSTVASTLAHDGTVVPMNPPQRLQGRRAGRARKFVDNIVQH